MLSKILKAVNRKRWIRIPFNKLGHIKEIGFRFRIIGPECISIGNNFYAENNLKLQAWKKYKDEFFCPEIVIGDNVSIMDSCQISCCNRISIGDGCLFGDNVFITDNLHGRTSFEELCAPPIMRPLYSKGPVIVGKNVWLGRNVCVMPGVTIGDGAIVGANSVITHDVESYSVVGGVPAKVIKSLGK